MRARHLLLIVALAVAALPATAQWKWRDKSGRVTASDLPPPRDVADKDILQRPTDSRRAPPSAAAGSAPAALASAPAVSASRASAPVDRELEARKRAAEQEQQAKARADDEKAAGQRADNCRRARSQLALMQSGQRIVRGNERGEREFLDDRQRADEARRAQDVITADCR